MGPSMRKTFALFGLYCAVLPQVLHAQEADDVVVMRRKFTISQIPGQDGNGTTPVTPTPGQTPTPTPAPTPTPTPIVGSWETGTWEWSGPAACTQDAPQTRSVRCVASGAETSASNCSGPAPEATRTAARHDGCTFSATGWGGWTPSSTCSAASTKSRSAQCLRSDGAIVSDEECLQRDVGLTETVAEANYSSCSHEWRYSAYVDPGSNCSAKEYQARVATCVRTLDGQLVDDALCDVSAREPLVRVVPDYSGCHPFWYTTDKGWSDWSSTCSATATRTREVGCFRNEYNCTPETPGFWADYGDGSCSVRRPESECHESPTSTSEGFSPESATETAAVYTGCSNSWSYSQYEDPGASCSSAEAQTRTAVCKRDLDGEIMLDSACDPAAREPLTRTVADYSSCRPFWFNSSDWGPWSSTCSNSATRTRSITCGRIETNCQSGSADIWDEYGNGTCARILSDAQCESSQWADSEGWSKADGTETAAVYSGCTGPTTWSAADPQISHQAGYAVGGGWGANPGTPQQMIVYGPYLRTIAPGSYTALWSMTVDDNSGDDLVATVDVYNYAGQQMYATMDIHKRDFAAAGVAQTFEAPFAWTKENLGGGHAIEIRVQYKGSGTLIVHSVGFR